jgi:hypothetical protein
MGDADSLRDPIEGAEHSEFGGVSVDVVTCGNARVKRVIYPPGYRWSKDLKPVVGGDYCMHGHVGFLAAGRMQGEYADGCKFDYSAPAALVVEPGHDAWTVGDEPAVFIEFDYERDTVERLGLPAEHRH